VEKPDLTIAAVPALDSAGVYIAQQRGLFAAEGLHVKIVPAISSSTVIAAQMKGEYDVTAGAYPSYILADALHHADLRVLAAASTMSTLTQEIMVPSGSPIQSVAELKGKRIGVNVLDNLGTMLVSSVLTDNAVDPASVHFVAIPFPAMAAALKAHKVDAAWLPEPFISGAEESIGAQPLADADQGVAQNLPVSGYIVTQSWLSKYPRTAAAFRTAIQKAQVIAASDLGAVQQAMVQFAGVPRTTAAITAAPGFPTTTEVGPLQRVADLMEQFGMIQIRYDVAGMIR